MKRNIYLLAGHNFLIDFRFFAPILALYFAKVSGSYTLGMSIFSIIFISSALFEIPTGVMSDRIGRKWTLVIGALASTLGIAVYALAGNYTLLVIGAVFEGFSRALYSGNNNTEYGHYAQNVSLIATQLGLGACSIGGFIDDGLNRLLDFDWIDESVIGVIALGTI